MNQKEKVDQETKRLVALVGSNIRSYRKAKGLTQEKLAELADINEKYLSSIENGNEANLSIGYLVAVATAMELSPFALMSIHEKN